MKILECRLRVISRLFERYLCAVESPWIRYACSFQFASFSQFLSFSRYSRSRDEGHLDDWMNDKFLSRWGRNLRHLSFEYHSFSGNSSMKGAVERIAKSCPNLISLKLLYYEARSDNLPEIIAPKLRDLETLHISMDLSTKCITCSLCASMTDDGGRARRRGDDGVGHDAASHSAGYWWRSCSERFYCALFTRNIERPRRDRSNHAADLLAFASFAQVEGFLGWKICGYVSYV